MANNRDITDLPLEIFTQAMPHAGVTDNEVTSVMSRLAPAASHFHKLFRSQITDRAFKKLCQAIIDDDRKTVKRILDAKPELLLMNNPKDFVVESNHTWQKIFVEKIFTMVVKRKQIEMIKIILPYFDKLDQTDEVIRVKNEGLSAWDTYSIKENPDDLGEVVVPEEYMNYAQALVELFQTEEFPDDELSEEAQLVLSKVLDDLLPKNAVELDEDCDRELFLLAVYKVFLANSNQLTPEQRIAFSIRVIGLIQSTLSPEVAKIFCEGIIHVIEENKNVSDRAAAFKLLDDQRFYRTSRESKSGLGYDHVCTVVGKITNWLRTSWSCAVELKLQTCLENYLIQRQQAFELLRQKYLSNQPDVLQRSASSNA